MIYWYIQHDGKIVISTNREMIEKAAGSKKRIHFNSGRIVIIDPM